MSPRVLHVLGGATIDNTAFARIVTDLARAKERRFRVEALFLGGDGPLAEDLRREGVPTETMDWPLGVRQPLGALRFWRFVRRGRFVIIHVHFGGRSVRWIARSLGSHVVFHVHSHTAEFRNLERVRIPAGGSHVVIADCQALANAVVGTRPRVVYLGVPVPELISRDPSPRFVVGCLGRLAPVKGTIHLISAVEHIRAEAPELYVEIAGSGPEQERLQQEVLDRNLSDRIRFLGWKPDPRQVLAEWDMMAQPSMDDGFPLSVLEAMAAGVPVVASSVGGIPEMISDEETGWLVPPGDPESLGQVLLSAYRDRDRVREVGVRARETILARFSVDQMARAIESLYDEVLGSHAR